MAEFNRETVEHIASLARLGLTEDEIQTYQVQLASILEYVEQLSTVDTSRVEPTAHVLDIADVFRTDKPVSSFGTDEALANAPDKSGAFFRVPRVLEG